MIYIIVGDNQYQADQEVRRLASSTGLVPERYFADALSLSDLADMIRGGSLFATQRLIVINGLSEQKELWSKIAEWTEDVANDTTLVLIETRLDKRTKAYKALAKVTKMIPVPSLTEKQQDVAREWLVQLAKKHHIALSPLQVQNIVQRAVIAGDRPGVRHIDQAVIARAVDTLAVLDTITDEAIDAVLPKATGDTVFELLRFAIMGDRVALRDCLDTLRLSDDPYYVFAMLAHQWTQLVAVSYAVGDDTVVAAELGVHPYAVGQSKRLAAALPRTTIRRATQTLADLDARLKRSEIAGWHAVEAAVAAITQ